MQNKTQESQLYVNGMHCASCELLIENKLLERKNIKSVDVSQNKGTVLIEYVGKKPKIGKLNKIFKKDNYVFSHEPQKPTPDKSLFFFDDGYLKINKNRAIKLLPAFILVAIIFGAFLKFTSSGLGSQLIVTKESSLVGFFIFGVIAGLSTCSALVGGIILSMSKQWAKLHNDSRQEKLQRIVSDQ